MHDHNEKFFDDEPLPPGYHRHSDGTVHTHAHLEDGSIPPEHLHSHEHDHSHGHTHTHTQTKAVLNRLSIQLAAVRSALSSTAKVILKDHMEHCISEDGVDAEEQMRALNEAIDKFM